MSEELEIKQEILEYIFIFLENRNNYQKKLLQQRLTIIKNNGDGMIVITT